MNPFEILASVQADYLTHVRTFQRFQNSAYPRLDDGAHRARYPALEAALRKRMRLKGGVSDRGGEGGGAEDGTGGTDGAALEIASPTSPSACGSEAADGKNEQYFGVRHRLFPLFLILPRTARSHADGLQFGQPRWTTSASSNAADWEKIQSALYCCVTVGFLESYRRKGLSKAIGEKECYESAS